MKPLKQHGLILLTTLLMITTLTLLILTSLRVLFLTFKANNQVLIQHNSFYQLEKNALQIKQQITEKSDSPCISAEKNPNAIIDLLMQNRGCLRSDNQQHYYYLIQDLGSFSCLQIAKINRVSGSHHWLISIANLDHTILQIRFARPESTLPCTNKNRRRIAEGIVSWRYLSAKYRPSLFTASKG